jgi:hypothetical protein
MPSFAGRAIFGDRFRDVWRWVSKFGAGWVRTGLRNSGFVLFKERVVSASAIRTKN